MNTVISSYTFYSKLNFWTNLQRNRYRPVIDQMHLHVSTKLASLD